MVHAPGGVPGIGEGLPLQAVEVPADPGKLAGHAARLACRPGVEIARHRRGIGAGDKPRPYHRLTIAQRPGRLMIQAIAARWPSTRPPALAHGFGHSGRALGLGGQAMPLIHRLQDGAQQHTRDRVGIRYRAVQDLDARPFRLVLENQRQVAPPGDARGIQGRDDCPGAGRIAQGPQQGLEAGPIIILARLHRVGIFGDDGQALLVGISLERPALGVQAQIMPIFRAAQVSTGLAWMGWAGWHRRLKRAGV